MSPEMKNEFNILCSQIDKKFGKGTMQNLNDEVNIDPDNVISTGSIALNTALGIGGYPKGRIVEIYGAESSGKSTLCLQAVAEAQTLGKRCVYIDAEHTLDPLYAQNVGCNLDELTVCQPDNGEQALEVVNMCCRSGEVGLIIVDSVAALVPKAELEGEITDNNVAGQARMMSKAMRMITGNMSKTGCTVIFVNQVRMKIGVMFGCFHYDARILLEDGTTEKIGKIVNNKMDVKVLSRSKDGALEAKKIIDWHNNGEANKFYNLVIDYPHGKGRSYLPVGDDHKIFTPSGERLASDLKIEDEVLVRSKSYLTNEQKEVAVGTFLGDGSLRVNDAGNTCSLRLGHSLKQKEYLKYKSKFLGEDFMNNEYSTGHNGIGCDSHYTNELTWLAEYKRSSAMQYVDEKLLTAITIRAMCIWYLDDGTFSGHYKRWGWGKSEICASKLDTESKLKIANHCLNLGLPIPTITDKGFLFSGERNRDFHKAIAKYTPRCMDYKIHPKFRIACDESTGERINKISNILIPAKIVDIYDKPKSKATHKFDITVEDNHSYFVDNVLVHNSPKTTSGGNALKFYASQRLEIVRTGSEKEGDNIVGNNTKVKIVKNKTAPPFKTAEFVIRFGKGVDQLQEILELAVEDGVMTRAGAWYKYQDKPIAQGKPAAKQWLKDNEKIREEIQKEVYELRGLI